MTESGFELSKPDIALLGNTAQSLRRMRHAATCSPHLREKSQIADITEPLVDAEILGTITSQYLISLATGSSSDKERESWVAKSSTLADKYRQFKTISSTHEPFIQIAYSMWGVLFRIEQTWNSQLQFSIDECKLPFKATDLLDSRLGIFVPLAGDYLQIAVLREFITRQVTPDCFRLKPAALTPSRNSGTLPRETGDESDFSNCSRIGVLVDIYDKGKTYHRTLSLAKKQYPDKEFLDP